jgi:uncharacterized protein YbjT (DUF2867 family)
MKGNTMRIAVAGGTGLVGRLVVAELRAGGHEPVIMARSTGVDLTTGAGLERALEGCQAVIDVSNVTTNSEKAAVGFFGAATEHLLDSGQRAGVEHVVALSIIGIYRTPLPYYAGKRHQEQLIAHGPLPWTVMRAAQFHEFAGQMLERTTFGPVAVVPRMLTRPVAAREVATRLVRLAGEEPQGLSLEMAGPEQLRLPDMARQLLSAQGRRKLVLPVRLPGAAGKAMASGDSLPVGEFVQGEETFGEYLAGLR